MTYLLLLLRYEGSKNGHALIFETFLFLIGFWWGFLQMIPYEKCNKSYPKHFFVKINVFCVKGVKGFKKWDFAGDVKFLFFIRFWWGFLHLIPLNESFQ